MFLEEFAKERLVGEIQLIGDFLYTLCRILEQYSYLKHHVVVNPLVGSDLTYCLDSLREVVGGDVELLGIPTDAPLCTEILFQQLDEFRKDDISTVLGLVASFLNTPDDIAHVVEHGQKQGFYQLCAVVILSV